MRLKEKKDLIIKKVARVALMGGGKIRLIFTADAASITVTTTLAAGAPARRVVVTESDGAQTVYNTSPFTHNRVTAGDMRVEIGQEILPFVTHLYAFSCGLKGTFTRRDLRKMPRLIQLRLYTNAALACNFSLSDLTGVMEILMLHETASRVTGALSNLPVAMRLLYLYNTLSAITGSLADLPGTMEQLFLNTTASVVSGGGNAPRGLTQVWLQNLALDQPTVNGLLWALYVAAASPRTGTGGTINVGGTNAAPSGVFAAPGACPVTAATDGKEIAHALLNDGCAVGFNKWATVTITA
jgi:hypothetical protein